MDNCENCKHSSSSDDFIINCHLLDEIKQLKQEIVILQEAVEYHNLVKCPKCGYYSLPEYVCHNCGYEESEE